MLTFQPPELTSAQFDRVRSMLHDICGITLPDGKAVLVRSRLAKRLRALGMVDFDAYLRHVGRDHEELVQLIDVLTTNKTSFFREPAHFDHLRRVAIPESLAGRARLRIWSAGCSTGEEPYSIAATILDTVGGVPVVETRVLATDISTRVLGHARTGVYSAEACRDVPPAILSTCFRVVPNAATLSYRVEPTPRRLVTFARLNLVDHWPMKGPFDVIFCRNVMIYFDRSTRMRLVDRFVELLRPGGYLYVGHSESLTRTRGDLAYVQPAVYRR